jgi:hypothetical protein
LNFELASKQHFVRNELFWFRQRADTTEEAKILLPKQFPTKSSCINVEGVTLVLPSRPFMFIKYWRILALS